MKKRRVVITGMGIVSCFGNDVQAFYQKLLAGKSGVKTITRFDASQQPTTFAAEVQDFSVEGYIEKKQARRVDPFIRYAIVAGKKALKDAGLSTIKPTNRAGVIIGSGMGGMSAFYDGSIVVSHHGSKRLTPFFVPSIITNMAGATLAIDCGFSGPNYSISTACATGNYCLLASYDAIRYGQADLMVAGSTEAAINPIGMAGFMSIRALSTRNDAPEKASRPWDRDRNGFVMGEGSGILILEELERAKARGARIYAELLGGFSNCDAHHITDPQPDGKGIMECMQGALESSHIHPQDINYINAHSTSTIAGDLCELKAIEALFQDHHKNILTNSTKSMTGHCLGAAGALEAVVTVMAIHTKKIHPTLNLDHLDEKAPDMQLCPNQAQSLAVNAALSNSFGFGGHNCCLVFAPYDA